MKASVFFAFGLLIAIAPTTAQTHSFVDRMDPPFWWASMPVDTVQVMMHGERLAQFAPKVDHPGVTIARVEHGDSPNYAFVYLRITPEAIPGTVEIQWWDAQNRQSKLLGRTLFELKKRAPRDIQGYTAADAICLITPDRFANGDPSNDMIARLEEGVNRANDDGRHGGDIAGIREHLDYLDGMGFTAIWLNPILENNQPKWSYHGYATTDYYQVDARFGTNEEYGQLAKELRQRGMKLIMDMIMNHCGSEHWWMTDLPTLDWINGAGEFSPTTHRRTTLRDPYALESDRKEFTDGWFVKEMPDLNQRQPLLADYLIQNSIWWIEFLGLGGIRMDTYCYADADFMSQWSCAIMDAYPNFNMCGEEWSLNPAVLAYWQAQKQNADGYTSCLPGLLDFPLHDALIRSLVETENWHSDWVKLYEMLGSDFLYPDPLNHVIFPDNHDMSRVHSQLGDDVDLTRLALYFFATARGIPQFYYGSEILMTNTGNDSHGNIRSDFPGGWIGDAMSGFSGEGLSEEAAAFQEEVRILLNWRKNSEAVHEGTLKHYVPVDGAYVYFREAEDQAVMVVLHKATHSAELDLGRFDEVLNGRRVLRNVITEEELTAGSTLVVPPMAAFILEVE